MSESQLNERTWSFVETQLAGNDLLRSQCSEVDGGGRTIDCGITADGGREAGLFLARLTLSDLAEVSIGAAEDPDTPFDRVFVKTAQPVAACMASQYAGWQISIGDFFAMGSGPMRAAYGGEELFEDIGHVEQATHIVGALETRQQPSAEVFEFIASKTNVAPGNITLALAPTASTAGGIQVVARSVETALHKLHELGFDLSRVRSGSGSAPIPPTAANDMAAIGRTNDAVLYGARVELEVTGDDDSIAELGAKTPSSASADHGALFIEIFERYDRDFYRIDPGLFSPAEISFRNLDTGNEFTFGQLEPELLKRSFLE
ncbi:MAG: methenyltetrahydromethanopterin cyclohydrolase [Planctomycetota bacterium]|nr:methenyltetrahydromethanopterin cyclohydrolase [Planctomycetota bacterium]